MHTCLEGPSAARSHTGSGAAAELGARGRTADAALPRLRLARQRAGQAPGERAPHLALRRGGQRGRVRHAGRVQRARVCRQHARHLHATRLRISVQTLQRSALPLADQVMSSPVQTNPLGETASASNVWHSVHR